MVKFCNFRYEYENMMICGINFKICMTWGTRIEKTLYFFNLLQKNSCFMHALKLKIMVLGLFLVYSFLVPSRVSFPKYSSHYYMLLIIRSNPDRYIVYIHQWTNNWYETHLFQITTKRINFIVDEVSNDSPVAIACKIELDKNRSWLISSLRQMYSRR